MPSDRVRLSSMAHGGGCGCKISPAVLSSLLADMPKAQPPLKRRADVFGQDHLLGRIAGDLRRWRRNRQESRGLVGVAFENGGARDLSAIINAIGPGQIHGESGGMRLLRSIITPLSQRKARQLKLASHETPTTWPLALMS